jgi:hypothetical protein
VLDCVKSDSRTEIFCLSENASHALLAKDLSIPLQKREISQKVVFLKNNFFAPLFADSQECLLLLQI